MDINTICNDLLDALVKADYHEHTIYNYIGVVRRFKAFCEDKCLTEYTPDFGKVYADDVISSKTGNFSKNRYYSQGRFVRLLNSYYNAGTFDFGSTAKMGAGTNVQRLLLASHDLDCPWRPSDVGHILRNNCTLVN